MWQFFHMALLFSLSPKKHVCPFKKKIIIITSKLILFQLLQQHELHFVLLRLNATSYIFVTHCPTYIMGLTVLYVSVLKTMHCPSPKTPMFVVLKINKERPNSSKLPHILLNSLEFIVLFLDNWLFVLHF